MSDLHPEVEPLTQAEAKWIDRLKKVLDSCPTKRLELVTIGDPSLQIIDAEVADRHGFDLSDGGASESGVVLDHIRIGMKIHGVSG